MKKVYFNEENVVIKPIKKIGYWFLNVGVFVLLAVVSAVALCLTVALL